MKYCLFSNCDNGGRVSGSIRLIESFEATEFRKFLTEQNFWRNGEKQAWVRTKS